MKDSARERTSCTWKQWTARPRSQEALPQSGLEVRPTAGSHWRVAGPFRCHRMTVSGFTSWRQSFQPVKIREMRIQKIRSRFFSRGRFCWRARTASCCLNAWISSRSLDRPTRNTRQSKHENLSAAISSLCLVKTRPNEEITTYDSDPESGSGRRAGSRFLVRFGVTFKSNTVRSVSSLADLASQGRPKYAQRRFAAC